ncbi:MAG: hypothetical protein JRH03_11510 [Deltaproteobacteria bacterium]|nr:hypothetical protein [Deltaproteobacteria bacterium]
MLSRERIIVLLMIVAVTYGAYSLFLAPDDKTPVDGSQKQMAELKNFVVDAATKLSSEYVSAADKYIIEQAEKTWPQSPFLQSGAILTTQPFEAKVEVKVEKMKLSYTGFLQVEDSLLAVVNGMEYETGEQLNQAGYYIKSISPAKVVIGIANNPKTIILPLDEDVSVQKESKE